MFLYLKSTKKDNFEVPPQGVDQLLHVDQLLGVDKFTIFFCSFFVDFSCEIPEKALKWTKNVKKWLKKNVLTSFRVLQASESWSKYTTHVRIKKPFSCLVATRVFCKFSQPPVESKHLPKFAQGKKFATIGRLVQLFVFKHTWYWDWKMFCILISFWVLVNMYSLFVSSSPASKVGSMCSLQISLVWDCGESSNS